MSIFNVPINSNISSSLALRQKLMGQDKRSPQELTFLNSKTNWVSLKSAVDVNNDNGFLAKNNILEGGSLINGKLRYGVNPTGSYSFQNSQGKNNELGIRPMPGVTSVSVENIGAYGSLRKATINYQCWDVNQLEILEQLYMRPGYLVLLEFGRTVYLENNKIIQNTSKYNFFEKENIILLNELNKLYDESIKSKGNYDAFLGYVVNYGWQIRPDGGYDCKTEIISTGELLESLKTNYSLATDISFAGVNNNIFSFKGKILPSIDIPSGSLTNDDLTKINQDYNSNILSGVIRELHTLCKIKSPLPSDPSQFSIKLNNTTSSIDIAKLYYSSEDDSKIYQIQNSSKQNYYITLGSFIEILNDLIIPHINNSDDSKSLGALTKLSVKSRKYVNDNEELLNCLYNVLMTSVNPDVCFIKNKYWINVIKGIDIQQTIAEVSVDNYGPNTSTTNGVEIQLQSFIITQIEDIISKNNISSKSKVLDLIDAQYKKFEELNKITKEQFYELFQKVYQKTRGGKIIKSYTNPPTVDSSGKPVPGSETKTTITNQSWDIIGNKKVKEQLINTTTKKTNTGVIGTVVEIFQNSTYKSLDRFVDLFNGNPSSTPDQNKIYNELNNTKFINEVDKELDTRESNLQNAKNQVKQIEENKTKLNVLGDDYESIINSIPLSFITENNDPKQRKFGIISNIYLNLKYLYYLATDINITTQDPSGKNILSLSQFIHNLMKNVQSSIGNVNNFELHIDDRDGIGRIIDLNYINPNNLKDENIFELEIGSNKSIIRDLKLESKIFSDQVSMMAISAQAASGRLGYDNTTMVSYNKGITDRLIPSKSSPSVTNKENKDSLNNLVSSLSGLVSQFFVPFVGSYYKEGKTDNVYGGAFSPAVSPSCQYYLRDIINFFTSIYNTDNKNNTFLPAYLSFTIDGIGGLVIGNVFSIDKTFIPKSYKNSDNSKFKYTIMKVSQELNQNDWVTTVDAIPLPPISEKGDVIDNPTNFLIVTYYEPNTNEIQITVFDNISPSDTIKKIYIPARDKALIGKPNGLKLLLTAQTQLEGFRSGTISYDLNNPGNFRGGVGNIKPIATGLRSTKSSAGYAKFSSLEDGIKTQEAQINLIISGGSKSYPKNATLEQYINIYAPPTDNNKPYAYIGYIISYFKTNGYNITKDTKLSQIISLK